MQPRSNSERIGHRRVPKAALHGKLNGDLAAVRGLAAGRRQIAMSACGSILDVSPGFRGVR
jgi:hypothetical protein